MKTIIATLKDLLRPTKRWIMDFWRTLSAHIFRISRAEREQLMEIKDAFPHVLSVAETMELIVSSRLSVARFGDAEFDIARMLNDTDVYQLPSEELSTRLLAILKNGSHGRLLVCIPPYFCDFNNKKNFYKNISFWEWYWLKNFNSLNVYFRDNRYGNSFISRNTVFHELPLASVKGLWNGRKVVFVVGRGARFKFDERLFGNILEVSIIEVPPTNAYSEYARIFNECITYDTNHLFLIAAGPTATLLVVDLDVLGYQAIDIGHISNCYHQYLGEADDPESLPLIAKSHVEFPSGNSQL
jgi:glycosyltransferase family protein